MSEVSVRFAVRDPTKTKRAATWKCWASTGRGKDDVYLACRELGGTIKASMHESGRWHVAFASDFFADSVDDGRPDRFLQKWPRPAENGDGLIVAYRVITG